ncbi:MAG TPA: hypothetical protein VFO23_01575 [Steroidobacteraceae bacterium]|nr:hypothetical protein [Steroidobacteraceae bacterium]
MPMRRLWLTALLFACSIAALAQNAPPALPPLAHSALVAVDAAAAPGGLALRVRRSAGPQPVAASAVTVSVAGKSEPASARADGTWFVPRPAGARDAGALLEVTVAHDGIQEVLSGRLAGTPAAAPGGAAAGSSRSQMAWWVLNIVIVLIAVIAISRRMS